MVFLVHFWFYLLVYSFSQSSFSFTQPNDGYFVLPTGWHDITWGLSELSGLTMEITK